MGFFFFPLRCFVFFFSLNALFHSADDALLFLPRMLGSFFAYPETILLDFNSL
ncbi:hypothetical protein Caka_0578 [Coraliomargarita akajimensis DSM 45221]|uniref:Uncharacterized protein n=1 Tax=Coraliomargarita akajimensis (strain DSM 45221 / IAM 15411 / JCM 23193 / KCTC 12865 / 04OKA010-24) TaxID=583355 RepID=D5ENU4_CORAD|nr:hypothetical protein Caka_0578 [Coraliomargarita akajimensis DSM 45221]